MNKNRENRIKMVQNRLENENSKYDRFFQIVSQKLQILTRNLTKMVKIEPNRENRTKTVQNRLKIEKFKNMKNDPKFFMLPDCVPDRIDGRCEGPDQNLPTFPTDVLASRP